MLRICIPQPCHERWEKMTPVEKGAYCKSCARTITDFTGMTDRELASVFSKYKGQKQCGRFLHTQLNRPVEIVSPEVLRMDIPAWKKYLAILLICFSGMFSGCNSSPAKNYDFPIPESATAFEDSLKLTDATGKAACHEDKSDNRSENLVLGNVHISGVNVTFTQQHPSIIEDIFGPPEK